MAANIEYKCPSCGGAIAFDAESQRMKCPYCGAELDVEALKSYDEALKADVGDSISWADGRRWDEGESAGVGVFTCESCGGELVADTNTAATDCPFCGNHVVLTGRVSGGLRPDLLIPFKLTGEQARAALKRHLKGKLLLPNIFRDENHINETRGIYVPFWLYDADADAEARFRATKVRSWSDSRNHYREISHYMVTRRGRVSFERVPSDGSGKMPDDLMESIEPYDFGGAVDFQTAYLAGFAADKYDVGAEAAAPRANGRIRESAFALLERTVAGYASVSRESGAVRLSNGGVRYALYPVWLLNTTWRGKKYVFAMNGQTGKFVGDLPTDWLAFWLWFCFIFTGASLLTALIMSFFL
ncbi:MAG: hypothetical protein LBK41_06190 [Clostridiales bacterium]|jgi:DNA-directed RNA polymerase subunit RPC12/RpoP|nr:hypothetical protein [Clostridiales bacterium]